VQELAEARKNDGLVLLINPQWQGGQAVSDFGFGPWKRRKEEFVATFQDVFFLKQFRIFGDNVRYVVPPRLALSGRSTQIFEASPQLKSTRLLEEGMPLQ
jgi:hypothetical protein